MSLHKRFTDRMLILHLVTAQINKLSLKPQISDILHPYDGLDKQMHLGPGHFSIVFLLRSLSSRHDHAVLAWPIR